MELACIKCGHDIEDHPLGDTYCKWTPAPCRLCACTDVELDGKWCGDPQDHDRHRNRSWFLGEFYPRADLCPGVKSEWLWYEGPEDENEPVFARKTYADGRTI